MGTPNPNQQSTFDAASAAVLEAQFAAAERIVNGVRIGVIGVLGVCALLWAPHLTQALNLVNLGVCAPMFLWAIAQHFAFHKPGRRWGGLSLVNASIDITAVSALLIGYGLFGMPDLALKSPIWTAYFVILAARPFTGAPSRAALAGVTAVVQYAAIAALFIGWSSLPVLENPLDTVRTSGTTYLDEAAKLLLLVVGGMVATYATAWNERTLRRSVEAMRTSEARFRAVFEHAAVGIVLLDESSTIIDTNAAFERFLGFERGELVGRQAANFTPAEDADSAASIVRSVTTGERASATAEMRFVRRDGQVAWGAVTVSRADGDAGTRLIAMVQDVTERKTLEMQLLHQAFHDPLTQLANRALFRDRVDHAITRTARESERIAVLFLDLDNFKVINDTLGHAAGDRLLEVVAARLLSATRGCDTVARLGGDEFAVLLEHVHAGDGAEIVAERIVSALRNPIELSPERSVTVSASAGIAVSRGGEGTEELLRNADVAMYAAKSQVRGRWVMYEPKMHRALMNRMTLEADLRLAIESNEFRLVYQPIIDLDSGMMTGIEALLRWTHAERGVVPPAAFIPVAEETGLIVALGRWVIGEACRQAAIWNAALDDTPITITVNLSAKQLQNDALIADVRSALEQSGLAPECLILEITETAIMHDAAAILTCLHDLKRLGVRLAIDDFGTGYSSLSYLQQFPVDVLKIDRSFTERMLRGTKDAALVRTIIALADTLTLRTIAEGVEDARQQAQLRDLGCDYAQGYLFSHPVSAKDIDALLQSGMQVAGAPLA